MKKAYLTVFLSLTISIMLSLILALLQNARICAIKMKAECSADISMNSVLAEFNRALFEQYDLLMVDCSYQTDSPSMANVEEHLRYFMQGNFDSGAIGWITGTRTMTAARCSAVSIPAYSFATDGNGAVLRRQILAYMEGEPVMDSLADASGNLVVLSSNGFDTHDVEAEAQANREELEDIEIPPQLDENGEEYTPIADNPADAVETQKGVGVVNLAVPDPSAVSSVTADLSAYASHREKNHGTGLDDGEELTALDILLLNQYMIEKTGCYTRPKDGSLFKYQLEYLIAGKDNDFDNLEHCARILLFWREASNFAYLMSDSAKVSEAETIADLIAAVIMVPEAAETIKMSILFAWSFAESICDMRSLYRGKKVPLIKTSESWHLSLVSLPLFRDFLDGGGGDEGLSYEDYLKMLLLLADMDEKCDRLCDLIEMDVRQTPGNEHFKLDWCLDVFQADMTVSSRIGINMHIVRTYGYEE